MKKDSMYYHSLLVAEANRILENHGVSAKLEQAALSLQTSIVINTNDQDEFDRIWQAAIILGFSAWQIQEIPLDDQGNVIKRMCICFDNKDYDEEIPF